MLSIRTCFGPEGTQAGCAATRIHGDTDSIGGEVYIDHIGGEISLERPHTSKGEDGQSA